MGAAMMLPLDTGRQQKVGKIATLPCAGLHVRRLGVAADTADMAMAAPDEIRCAIHADPHHAAADRPNPRSGDRPGTGQGPKLIPRH